MTPCVLRDGEVCLSNTKRCIGCDRPWAQFDALERAQIKQATKEWDKKARRTAGFQVKPTRRQMALNVPEDMDPKDYAVMVCPECKTTEFRVVMEKAEPNHVAACVCAGCGIPYTPPRSQ